LDGAGDVALGVPLPAGEDALDAPFTDGDGAREAAFTEGDGSRCLDGAGDENSRLTAEPVVGGVGSAATFLGPRTVLLTASLVSEPEDGMSGGAASSGSILAPMPGMVIAVAVAAGDKVTKGQKLLTLEAMKMEHSLTAPFDGVVAELNAATGTQVQVEALLVRIEASEE